MDDLLIKVIVEILNDFTPISLVAVILGNLFTELIKGWRGRQQQSRPVRETLAFLAVMAMMTGWAFLAVAIPLGMAGVARLAAAPAWLLTASLLLYLLIAFPLGYVMLGLLLNAQESTPLDRHELARRNTPFYVYGALVKLGGRPGDCCVVHLPIPERRPGWPGRQCGRAAALCADRLSARGHDQLWMDIDQDLSYLTRTNRNAEPQRTQRTQRKPHRP